MPTILSITKLPDEQFELSWQAKSGYKYHVQKSGNLTTWVDFAGPYDGEEAIFRLVIPAVDARDFFRLIVSMPDGTSINTRAITALDGSHVIIQWNEPVVNTENFTILRDNNTLATVPGYISSYKDTTVNSGSTYTYDVKIKKSS